MRRQRLSNAACKGWYRHQESFMRGGMSDCNQHMSTICASKRLINPTSKQSCYTLCILVDRTVSSWLNSAGVCLVQLACRRGDRPPVNLLNICSSSHPYRTYYQSITVRHYDTCVVLPQRTYSF